MKMTRKFLSLFFIFTFLLAGCSTKPIQSADSNEEIIPVHIADIKKGSFQTAIELTGRSMAVHSFPVIAPAPMVIEKVHVTLGQRVRQGDMLLTFDKKQAQEQLDAAKKQVRSLEAALAEMKETQKLAEQQLQAAQQEQLEQLQRAQAVVEGAQTGAVTMLDLLQASTQLLLFQSQNQALPSMDSLALQPAQLNLQLEQAQAQVKLAEQSIEQLTVTAPFDGTITYLQALDEQIAVPNTPLLQLSNMEEILIDLQISPAQINKLAAGMPVTVKFEGEEEVHQSTLTGLSPAAALQTNTFQGQVLLRNENQTIYPGKLAKVEVVTATEAQALLVPVEAVFYQENQTYVYIVKDDKAHLTAVTLGERNQQEYVILEGLKAGDKVVTGGKERVTDGRKVYIQK